MNVDLDNNLIVAKAAAQLSETVATVQYMAGDTIATEGTDQGILYIVQQGSCGLYKMNAESNEDEFVGKLSKGEMGGLDALLDNGIQVFTCKAEEDSEILKITHSEFMACVRESDELMQLMFDRMRLALQTPRTRARTSGGLVKVAFFDAKGYDIQSFNFYNSNNELKFIYIEEKLSEDTVDLADGCKVVCLFVNDTCDRNVLEMLRKIGIEMVTMRCAGFDRVDLEAADELGITVARVPAYSPYAVAEHAAALLQMINRKLNVAWQRVKSGNFSLSGLVGFDLYGKKCGVLGTGKIGQCFINIALGFGMEVLMYDVYKCAFLEENPRCRYVEMDEVFSECDVVSIHLPLLPSTQHVVNERTLGLMKKHAILLNVSRGGLVSTEALINALKSEQIGGAGLDVYENESAYFFADWSNTNIADDVLTRLLSFRNCIVTSHQAFLTEEALQAISQTTIANVKAFSEGKVMKECSNSLNKV